MRRWLVLVLTGGVLTGCTPTPAPGPAATPEVTPGVARQDAVLPGASSTLRMTVVAETFYAVWFGASGGSEVRVALSGAPLAAPVDVLLADRTDAAGQPQGMFYARSAGELQIVITNTASPAPEGGGLVDSILYGDDTPTTTTLRIDELGPEDHGETPDEASALAGDGTIMTGTLEYGDTTDYFTLPVAIAELYSVRLEATRALTLATANIDSFGQFNFDVATSAGNRLSLTAEPGAPASGQLAINAAEVDGAILLAVQAASVGVLDEPLLFADYPVEYTVTVTQVTAQQPVDELTAGEERRDTLVPGGVSTLRIAVDAGTFYAVWLSAPGGFNVELTLSGTPLAAPLAVELSALDNDATEPRAAFYAEGDGEVEIVLRNGSRAGASIETTLRVDDLGADDHGEHPDQATAIAPASDTLGGTLLYGETYDYFSLPAQLGELFNVTFEATYTTTLATASVDVFGQFNFDVATSAGNQLHLIAQPGVPATGSLPIIAAEDSGSVLLAVRAATGILTGPLTFADSPIEYAVTVERVTSQALASGDTRSGQLAAGFTAQYFIDVGSILDELTVTLSGPDGLVLYVRKGQPASFEEFDHYLVLGGGAATDTLTIGPPQIRADRYYLTIGNILGEAADYILEVEID